MGRGSSVSQSELRGAGGKKNTYSHTQAAPTFYSTGQLISGPHGETYLVEKNKQTNIKNKNRHVPAGSERGPVPGQGADCGQHEPQREEGGVCGSWSDSPAGDADREGAERGSQEAFHRSHQG